MELDCSDYWRMRLSNAIASSDYNRGEFDSALKWIGDAWKYAERAGADWFKSRILFNRAGLFYGMGRHRDSVDQHKVAVLWARRIGSKFDYLSACAGLSINLLQLAQYEAAIREAIKARETAVPPASLRAMGQLTRRAEVKGAFVVQLYGAGALAEIMLNRAVDDPECLAQTVAALARADQSGVAETGWWLSYCLGEIASRRRELREAQSCFR